MNPNELRIGNYVSPLGIGISKVEYIDGRDNFIECDNFSERSIDDFNPIPLTEEWLLKFRFILKSDVDGEYYEKNGVKVLILRSETIHFFFGNPNTKEKLVHELQNFYFVSTGEDI